MRYRKRWTGPFDELSCQLCLDMIGETAPLHMSYNGEIWSLPCHPDCRCKAVIEEVDSRGNVVRCFDQNDD